MDSPRFVSTVLSRVGRFARSWAGGFTIALVLLGMGTATAATGGVFTLGKANSAGTTTALNNTGKGPALKLGTKAAKTPNLVVSNSAKILKLNADLFDGLDSAALQRRVSGTCAEGTAATGVTAQGGLDCVDLLEADEVPGTDVYTVSGSYVVPAGVTRIRVEVWGGGGSGERDGGSSNGGPGGGAGAYLKSMLVVTPGETCTVTIGIGGTWVTATPTGGTTTVTCDGGAAAAPGGSAGVQNSNTVGVGGDPGPYGTKGGDGSAGTGTGGLPGLQVGGGDVGGFGRGGKGSDNAANNSDAGAPGLAIITAY